MWDKVWMNPVAGPSQPRSIFGAADRGGYELGTKGIRRGDEAGTKGHRRKGPLHRRIL